MNMGYTYNIFYQKHSKENCIAYNLWFKALLTWKRLIFHFLASSLIVFLEPARLLSLMMQKENVNFINIVDCIDCYPPDIKILGWCPAWLVLPHR